MTVESYYVIAIATLSDWLKRLAPVFQPMRIQTKTIAPCTRDFTCASSELQVIARNCDWFIALPAPVVIGRSNCFGFGFSTVIWKLLDSDRSIDLLNLQIIKLKFLTIFLKKSLPELIDRYVYVILQNEKSLWYFKGIYSKQYAKLICITSSAMFSITRFSDLLRKLPVISHLRTEVRPRIFPGCYLLHLL